MIKNVLFVMLLLSIIHLLQKIESIANYRLGKLNRTTISDKTQILSRDACRTVPLKKMIMYLYTSKTRCIYHDTDLKVQSDLLKVQSEPQILI